MNFETRLTIILMGIIPIWEAEREAGQKTGFYEFTTEEAFRGIHSLLVGMGCDDLSSTKEAVLYKSDSWGYSVRVYNEDPTELKIRIESL